MWPEAKKPLGISADNGQSRLLQPRSRQERRVCDPQAPCKTGKKTNNHLGQAEKPAGERGEKQVTSQPEGTDEPHKMRGWGERERERESA